MCLENKRISTAVIRRLPRYYRYLGDLVSRDIQRISSKELSQRMNITASQIRQDLNIFGCFGQQGYGYNVVSLYEEIKRILGLTKTYKLIIVGMGNLGHALMNHESFSLHGYDYVGVFDKNPEIVGKQVSEFIIQDIDSLPSFLEENQADIAILAVTKSKAIDVAKFLIESGVKAIWNFTNKDLQILESEVVHIENVHLTDSLMTLSYKLNEK